MVIYLRPQVGAWKATLPGEHGPQTPHSASSPIWVALGHSQSLAKLLSDLSWPHTDPVGEAGQVVFFFPLDRRGNRLMPHDLLGATQGACVPARSPARSFRSPGRPMASPPPLCAAPECFGALHGRQQIPGAALPSGSWAAFLGPWGS